MGCNISEDELTVLSPALLLVNEVDLSENKGMGIQGYHAFANAIVRASGEAAQKKECIILHKLSLTACNITSDELTAFFCTSFSN